MCDNVVTAAMVLPPLRSIFANMKRHRRNAWLLIVLMAMCVHLITCKLSDNTSEATTNCGKIINHKIVNNNNGAVLFMSSESLSLMNYTE